jgi:hypothetical protein
MSDLKKAAKQALAHVQEFKRRWMAVPPFGNKVNKATREAVTLAHVPVLQLEEALRTALAQQQEQEPVAWIHRQGNHWDVSERILTDDEKARGWTEEPLFTHPPRREWQSLTEEEMKSTCAYTWPYDPYVIARAIEAALKERNT